MSDQPHAARKYGEKEIGKILERATELQKTEPGHSTGGGMTLAELEEVATEAGIDVHHLRRAALELDGGVGESTAWSTFLGAELSVTRETSLPGEVPEGRFEDLLGVLQATVRDSGHPSLLGKTLTWQGGSPDNTRKLRVLLSARGGRTTLRGEENLSQLAGGLFGGIGGGVGAGIGFGVGVPLGVALGSAAAVVFPVAWLGITYLGVRKLYESIVRRRRRVVDELFHRLLEAASDAVDAGAPEPG